MAKYYTLFAILIAAGSLQAQIEEGYIKMVITEASFSQPEMAQMGAMMQNSTQEIYFSPDQQKTVIDMMNGMMKIQSFQKGESSEQYMDMMGQKIKYTIVGEEMDDMVEETKEYLDNLNVTYDKSDTKDILGFPCYKAIMKIPNPEATEGAPEEIKISMYITEKIKMHAVNINQSISDVKLSGTPMMMKLDMGMMTLTYEAQDFKEGLVAGTFDRPDGEYREMSFDDLQKMGMGMGNMGF